MASAALPATNDTHPFGVRDLVAFDRLTEPRVSPNGRQIVFTLSSLDLEANKRRTDLWVVGTDGAGLRPLLRSDDSVMNEEILIITTPGPRIAACLWDRTARVGGLNHFEIGRATCRERG